MPLAVGTKAPDFTLPIKTSDGPKQITLSENFGKRNTLLAFFPMVFTSTCTTEMCGISSDLAAYAEMNAAVYGISGDNPFAQEAWARKEGIMVPLLSDYEHKVARIYDAIYECFLPQIGLGMSGVPKRATFVIDRAGVIQYVDCNKVRGKDVETLANWDAKKPANEEIPFVVARIVLQDFTGVPLVVDLAAMRSAVKRLGGHPKIIEPLVPVDLVVDHSVQVDFFGSAQALRLNLEMEFKRNRERYQFLKWGQQAFSTFQLIPPGIGIVHQVNLEYLAKGVLSQRSEISGQRSEIFYPDTLVGTDSHTTMINGLGVVGWGVGGIEAEAGMLGQPVYFLTPEVVGVHLTGKLREGVTATDLVLHITQMLRAQGVVGKFVEFYG